jgi:preprotein translocase subunit SecF
MRIFANPNYNFIRWRWHALILSVVLIWSGVALVMFRGGLQYSIEFTGGTSVIVQFAQPVDEGVVRKAVDPISKDAVVQRYGAVGQNQVMVRLPMVAGQDQGAAGLEEGAKRIEAALASAGVGQFKMGGSELVGAVIGKDLQTRGIWATLTALGGILVYVAFRFRFTFAVGAIVAAFHDILITLTALAFFHYELSLNVVAAILTITGYSVNDTIVVFDRVRENQRLMRREPLDQIVNKSVNQTLGRTIITSGVTFLAVLALFLLGGEVLHGFAFTMLVGVITGTYSTVFIAAAIAIILSRRTPVAPGVQAQAKPRRA